MKRLTIDPVSRIEGHAKISIHLNDEGRVASTQLHITQTRGFEKFTEGRPFYEMPGITSRICGICPVSHLLASAKACDAILAVRIPATAVKLRELLHCAQFVQSHALSFFYLSSPDLLLGMDSDPAKRNVIGVIEKHPELARLGIELRKFGLQIIEGLAQERVHPSWVVPGGVNAPMSPQLRERILSELPGIMAGAERTIAFFKSAIGSFPGRNRLFRLRSDHVRRDGRPQGQLAALRRHVALPRRRRRNREGRNRGGRIWRLISARLRCANPT